MKNDIFATNTHQYSPILTNTPQFIIFQQEVSYQCRAHKYYMYFVVVKK